MSETAAACVLVIGDEQDIREALREVIAMEGCSAVLAAVPVLMSTSAPSRAPSGVALLPEPIDLDELFGSIRKTCVCASA